MTVEITKYSLKKMENGIDGDLKAAYLKYAFPNNDKDQLDTYIENYILELVAQYLPEEERNRDFIKGLNTYKNKHRQTTKKRWFQMVNDEVKYRFKEKKHNTKTITHDIDIWEQYERIHREEKMIQLFGATTRELINQTLDKIETWSKDKSAIHTFEYFNQMTPKQISSAFELDFLCSILNTIVNELNCNIDNITDRPNIMVERGIFSESSRLMDTSIISVENQETGEITQSYGEELSNEGVNIRTIINNPDYKIKYQALDDKDSALLNFLLSRRTKQFLIDQKVTFDFADLINNGGIYDSDGGWTYEDIKSRIKRMQTYLIEYQKKSDGKAGASFVILQDASYLPVINKKRIGVVTFSNFFYEAILNLQTTGVYSDQLSKISSSIAKELMFPLQRERFICQQGKTSYSHLRYNYSFFSSKFVFKGKNKQANIEKISNALIELKNAQLHIADFRLIGSDVFELDYRPMEDYEIYDFLKDGADASKIIKIDSLDEEQMTLF